jgi:hypothetical protein
MADDVVQLFRSSASADGLDCQKRAAAAQATHQHHFTKLDYTPGEGMVVSIKLQPAVYEARSTADETFTKNHIEAGIHIHLNDQTSTGQERRQVGDRLAAQLSGHTRMMDDATHIELTFLNTPLTHGMVRGAISSLYDARAITPVQAEEMASVFGIAPAMLDLPGDREKRMRAAITGTFGYELASLVFDPPAPQPPSPDGQGTNPPRPNGGHLRLV